MPITREHFSEITAKINSIKPANGWEHLSTSSIRAIYKSVEGPTPYTVSIFWWTNSLVLMYFSENPKDDTPIQEALFTLPEDGELIRNKFISDKSYQLGSEELFTVELAESLLLKLLESPAQSK